MNDLRRISWIAILLIILLRVSIGWQFLYEGMWKYGTLSGPEPWSAEGYLKNAQGPLRDKFRDMTGDPDDLNWLDYEKMNAKWYEWRDRFADHYQLTREQRAVLNILLDGDTDQDPAPGDQPPFPPVSFPLSVVPDSVDLSRFKNVLQYEDDKLIAYAPILPSEEAEIRNMLGVVMLPDGTFEKDGQPAPDEDVAFYRSFEALLEYSRKPIQYQMNLLGQQARDKKSGLDPKQYTEVNRRVSSAIRSEFPYRHRLAASLLGNPENVGVFARLNDRGSFDFVMGTVTRQEEKADENRNNIRFGKIQEYKSLLDEYESALSQAAIDYQADHATMLGRKVSITRNELVGPIKAMEAELNENAIKLLTNDQLSRGGVPPADTPLHRSDMMAMWGLLILGPLLIIGLFSRLAAIFGALMILSFYLVIPPWPGVPPAPGPEHSLFVNKNLIEVIALLSLAALPTGKWFGLDAFLSSLFSGKAKS